MLLNFLRTVQFFPINFFTDALVITLKITELKSFLMRASLYNIFSWTFEQLN